jgi:hypothetical protein
MFFRTFDEPDPYFDFLTDTSDQKVSFLPSDVGVSVFDLLLENENRDIPCRNGSLFLIELFPQTEAIVNDEIQLAGHACRFKQAVAPPVRKKIQR